VSALAVHWAVLISAFGIFWFLAFFSLLSVGLGEVDAETGAPGNPRLARKALWAAAIATPLWLAFYGLILARVLEL